MGREPVAIIGMGCRFPGVHDVESFWRVLSEGEETVGEYPGGRFGYIDQVYAANSPFADRIASRRGGFLSDIDRFDAEFFGISPREAALLDPQQRLLLEVAWEAIDDAGLVREQLVGSRTGVFVGVWTSDYEDCMYEDSPDVDFYATTGGGRYAASGRLAYFLDVRGPSLTVDTACSSSLVAIHLACQSLLTGESTVALAGGVNAILRPEITLVYSKAGMLAPDGRCKFGDASADGYVRSEGAGILVLKRLSQALADGDPIYAVIRGSAVNNDGQSSGLLVSPSPKGQEGVIRTALESAGLHPDAVDYVEAHGTGTPTGDPVEIGAIGRVMTTATRAHPCLIGSVKTNIGHTESAAGAAGVMKVALALDRGRLPASLHFREPSPRISWNELSVAVPTSTQAWPHLDRLPVAGVTGVGITGTNAHVVLEGVPPAAKRSETNAEERPFLFVLSGQTPEALTAAAESWRKRLREDDRWPSSLEDLAYTATVRRTHHEFRLALSAKDRSTLQERLGAWLDGDEQPGIVTGRRLPQTPSKAVFVYPGQGGQWIGMGRTLLDREPVFRDALLRCDAAIYKHTGWHVTEVLLAEPDSTRLNDIDVVQPTLFAVMVALTDLWRSLGVEPDAVVGHSMGEVAAAAVAGALSLDDAAAVICHRSRLMKRVRGQGLMAVVELSLDETRTWLENAGNVWIAASNGATSTVVSGDADAVEALLTAFEARDIFCRRIQVDVASHSGHMEPIRGELEAALEHIRPQHGALPMYSTTTGEIEDGARLDAAYWGKNLRQPVLFYPAVERLLADGFDAFVEVNAHPVLTHSLTDSIQQSGRDAVVTGSLRRNADEQQELLGALGALHAAGYPVDFRRLYPDGTCLRLPVYPWQRERHWFEPTGAPALRSPSTREVTGSSGARIAASNGEQLNPADSLYGYHWVDDPAANNAPARATRREPGRWIVLADERVGNQLAADLIALGDTCTLVRPGTGFRALGPEEFEVDPASEEDFRKVLLERMASCRGVIHAWSLSDVGGEPDLDGVWDAQSRGCFSAACVGRALARFDSPHPIRLWLISGGVQRVDEGEVPTSPWHGPLWGLGRVTACEHPELPCTNLDLSSAPDETEIREAAQLIWEGGAEQRMAVRGARRLVVRYQRCDDVTPSASSITANATYLLTGGLGALGQLAARRLVERGARHLVLVGRREPSQDARDCISSMESMGATVRVVAADVADPDHVTSLLALIEREMPPLKGVLHLAATVDHTLLIDASETNFRRCMTPKVAGAWNLYRGLQGYDLDFCLLYSSFSNVLTQPGSGSYAAGNAFLDALAQYNTSRGLRTRSIQWGPWAGAGLGNEDEARRSIRTRAFAAQGVQVMDRELGLALLERVLALSAPVILASPVDWKTFAASADTDLSAAEFAPLVPGVADSGSTEQDLRKTLAALAPGRPRLGVLETHLREQLAGVLKTSANRIDLQKPMGTMGTDSLMALEFVRRLSRSLGVKVPATAVFNYPTVKKLAAWIETRMEFDGQAPAPRVVSSPVSVAPPTLTLQGNVQDMSDEDALRALVGDQGAKR